MSIGARSQSAKTYLEKHLSEFAECKLVSLGLLGMNDLTRSSGTLEQLIRHGLHALRETLQQDKALSIHNTSIGIIGPSGEHEKGISSEGSFRILEGSSVDVYLQTMVPKEEAAGTAQRGTTEGDTPMQE